MHNNRNNLSPSSNRMFGSPNKIKKENTTKSAVQQAYLGVEKMITKINQKEENIKKMVEEIALNHNKLESKKRGFKPKLVRKKAEMKDHYKLLLDKIQSDIAIQLTENEKITSELHNLTSEIELVKNTPVTVEMPEFKFDYSRKTNRILKQRAEEIKEQCSQEFLPFFEKLVHEHEENLDSLAKEHFNEIRAIQEEALEALKNFKPRVYITQEEINANKKYEEEQQAENEWYEQQRQELQQIINKIEQETKVAVERISSSIHEQLITERRQYKAKIKKASKKEIQLQQTDFSKEFEITEAQEKEFRKRAEAALKSEFEEKLQKAVNEVQRMREETAAQIEESEKEEIKKQKENNELRIFEADNHNSSLLEEETALKSELSSLKNRWAEGNATRASRDEELSNARGDCLYYRDQLAGLERQYAKLSACLEEEEEESDELREVREELEALVAEFERAQSLHQRQVKQLMKAHENSKAKIKSRVDSLTAQKDEAIAALKQQIHETNSKVKSLGQELSKWIN